MDLLEAIIKEHQYALKAVEERRRQIFDLSGQLTELEAVAGRLGAIIKEASNLPSWVKVEPIQEHDERSAFINAR